MNLLLCSIRYAPQLLIAILLSACSSDSQSQEMFIASEDPAVRRAAMAVGQYVIENRDWKKCTYYVEFKRKEAATLVFWVVYPDDDRLDAKEERSFEVHVDPASNRVLIEMRFQ